MTPHDLVMQHYRLPFTMRPFQVEDVNCLAPRRSSGLYLEPGLGKTAVSTVCALYKLITGEVEKVFVIAPPFLVAQWARWLSRIEPIDKPPLRVSRYQGTPAQRKAVSLDVDFLLMGIQIFRKDLCIRTTLPGGGVMWEGRSPFPGVPLYVILDEAHAIKNVGSGIYHCYRDLVEGQSHQMLTGTPLNVPEDGYAYIRLVAPGVYRNLHHFNQTHVVELDNFNKPCEYKNLDLLHANMRINASRRTKKEVLQDLPECIVNDIEYELDHKHYALYKKLATNRLLELKNGEKLDATQVNTLYHALGQIVCQWHHFGQDDKLKSKIYDLIGGVLDELGDKKLIVFSNYQRTNEAVTRYFKCEGIWGQISPRQKQRALDRFLDDPKCRIIAMHPRSAGEGVDGCQHVCQDVLYAEPPITPSHFVQSLSRVHRDGQTQSVTVRLGVAKGTMQRHLVEQLTKKEALVMPIQGSAVLLSTEDVRRIIFGGT